MKTSHIAAAVLAALATPSTYAEGEIIVTESKTICIPAQAWEGERTTIYSLCDAGDFNKKNKLKLSADGCAVSGQTVQDGDGTVFDQIKYEAYEGYGIQSLPKCEDYDAAAYVVEL